MNEGQYAVSDALMRELNELDAQATRALDSGDESALQQALEQMSNAIRSAGTRLQDDDLSTSDVVVPPSDFTLEETRKLVSEEGLIPDPQVRA